VCFSGLALSVRNLACRANRSVRDGIAAPQQCKATFARFELWREEQNYLTESLSRIYVRRKNERDPMAVGGSPRAL
jgi:hypothetical protein